MRKSIWKKKRGDGDDVRMKYLIFLIFNRKDKKKEYRLICTCDVAEERFFSFLVFLFFFLRLFPCFVISSWATCGTEVSKKRLLCSPGLTLDKSDFLL